MYIKSRTQDNFFHKDLSHSERFFQTPRNIVDSNKQLNILYQKSKPLSSSKKPSSKRNFSQTSMGFFPSKTKNPIFQKTSLHSGKITLKAKVDSIISEFLKTNRNDVKHSNQRNNFSRSNFRFVSLRTPRTHQNKLESCFSQEETEKEMHNKFISCIANNSLKKEEANNKITQKTFRQILIRDFGTIKTNDLKQSQLERSKQLYNKQSDLDIDFDILKDRTQNLNELCKQQIDNYYRRRMQKKEANSKRIANEIREMICPDYEEIIVQPRSKSVGGKINYLNLERKIKVFHISKFTFDIDNDDLGTKNLPKLKTNLKKISERSLKQSTKVVPKFIKGKVKGGTINKYRSLLGMFFGTGPKTASI